MKTAIAKLGVLITATMLLAACGNSEGPGKGGGQVGLLSINLPPAELKVKVQNSAKKFDTVLETDAAMKEALISLHPNHGVAANPPNSFIKRLVTKIERDDNLGVDVPGLQGINWMYGHSLMEASKTKKNAQANKRVKVTVHGQITDFEFDTHNNPGTTNGKIAVTVFVTRRLLRQDGTVQDLNKQRFRWIIKVASGTYNVKRFNTASDPFPGTIAFSAAAIQKINAMGFNRKLWTIGQGIEVQKIFQWKNWPNGTEHELDPGLMKHKNLFAKTDDNCIDMLFKVDHDEWPHQFPPKNMTELNQYVAQSGLPPGYCLGRCANPFIVNTGF